MQAGYIFLVSLAEEKLLQKSGLKVLTKYRTLTKINGLSEQSNDRLFTLLGNRSGLKSM